MRVDVKIPGGVESYCIDERGDKRVASESLWLETFLCGVLRAYAYADNGTGDSIKKIIGVRRFDPITSTEVEHKFLEAAERLFFKGMKITVPHRFVAESYVGWQLGSEPEIQVPNLVSNHLTTGILDYIHTTGRYASGINLFEKLRTRDTEVSSLLARVLIAADEEVQAVKLLNDAVEQLPMDYSLLDCQATFCQNKGRLDWALECAKRSVTAAPSEFGTWAKLAEIYVGLEQWDLALLTLNSCPMFTYQDKDSPRMPEPARVVLPVLPESMLDEINEPPEAYDGELVHPSLRKLHAAGYKGTFLKAYSLLTEITAKIGWDQLLRVRSQVFVMEEEYRSEKQTGTSQQPTTSHNASTIALRGTPSPGVNGETISPQVNGEKDEEPQNEPSSPSATLVAEDATNGDQSTSKMPAADDSIEKPEHTITSEVVKSGNEDVSIPILQPTQIHKLTFPSSTPPTPATPTSTTSASVSVGSTTSSWFSTKTCASTPSGAPTWPAPNKTPLPLPLLPPPPRTTKAPRSGRSWVSWRSACTISPRPSRHTRAVCGSGLAPRPWSGFCACGRGGGCMPKGCRQ